MAKARARISQKEAVLLGLIVEEPAHAYGLEQKIRERRVTKWANIGFSSIYRVLSDLQRKRLISTRLVQAGQGAARKMHEITERGRKVLAESVVDYLTDMEPMRTPLLVGLAFSGHGRHPEVLKGLEARAAEVAATRGEVSALMAQFLGGLPPTDGENDHGMGRKAWLGVHLLFDHFQHHMSAEQKFLDEAIRLVGGPEGATFFAAPSRGNETARLSEVKS